MGYRVVCTDTGLGGLPLVEETAASRNRFLRKPGNTIGPWGIELFNAMEVNGGNAIEVVGNIELRRWSTGALNVPSAIAYFNIVALVNNQSGTWRGPVDQNDLSLETVWGA